MALLLHQSSTTPVIAMVLLTQSTHLAVAVLQSVRKGWDWRRSLSFTNRNQVSLRLLVVFIPAFMYSPHPFTHHTPHTTSTSLCNDTKPEMCIYLPQHRVDVLQIDQDGASMLVGLIHVMLSDVVHRQTSLLVAKGNASTRPLT